MRGKEKKVGAAKENRTHSTSVKENKVTHWTALNPVNHFLYVKKKKKSSFRLEKKVLVCTFFL